METVVIIALIIINIFTIYKFLFNLIFIDEDDFNKSVKYSFTPDIISLFRGEYWKDRGGEIKLGFFIMLCIIVTVFEYSVVIGIIKGF